jgi:predicted enzyme related to lactoylglutathione lyase
MSKSSQQIGIESVSIVSLVVEDLDEALTFYTETLDFELRMDEAFEMEGIEGRWVTIGLPEQDLEIALLTPEGSAFDEETRERLESQLGTGTGWTFRTGDCAATVSALEAAGVEITQRPTEYEWGIEAMFMDPFGNEFALFEYATA